MKHLFLTGDRQVGKSTLLSRWLSMISVKTGGFYTCKNPSPNGHLYVHILSASCQDAPCSDNMLFDCTDRRPELCADRFNSLGCALLESSQKADLIVMDEIGLMEQQADRFCEAVLATLDGRVPVIGVLRKDGLLQSHKGSLVSHIAERSDVTVIEVSRKNRDLLAADIPEIVLPFIASDSSLSNRE